MLKNNGTSRFAIKGADAQSGGVTTLWDGSLPPGYSPMRKQGAIILGSGGDCCKPGGGANLSAGTFYEGAMVSGYPSDATENAIQAELTTAGYGSAGGGATGPITSGLNSAKCVDDSAAGTANGNKIQMWDCQSGNPNQQWTVASNGTLQVYG